MLQGAWARATNRHKNTKERVVTASLAYSGCQEHAGIALRRRDQVAAINVNGASMPFREEPGTISEHVISEMHKSEWGRVFWINTTLFPEITNTWRLSFKYSTCKKSMTWYRFYCRALPIIWIEHSLQKKWQPAAEMMGVIKHTSLQTEGQLSTRVFLHSEAAAKRPWCGLQKLPMRTEEDDRTDRRRIVSPSVTWHFRRARLQTCYQQRRKSEAKHHFTISQRLPPEPHRGV